MPTLEEIRESLRTGEPLKKKSKLKGGPKMVYLGTGSYGLVTRCISTQAPSLDRILAKDESGRWGLPLGRSVFVMGKPSSGKTTLCLHLCAEAQKKGGLVIYIDAEHKLDRKYAKKVGVNVDEIIYHAPNTLEETLEAIGHRIQMVREIKEDEDMGKALGNAPIIIVVDSTSIATEAERETMKLKGGGKGEHARILSKFYRAVTPDIKELGILNLFICQIKSKIQIGWGGGNPETFLGDQSIKFQSSLGLRTQRISGIKDSKGEKVGDVVLFRTIKNQVANPLQEAKVELYYGKGLDYHSSLCDLLLNCYGAKKRAGGNYEHKGLGITWRGKRGLKKVMKDRKKRIAIRKLICSPARIKV